MNPLTMEIADFPNSSLFRFNHTIELKTHFVLGDSKVKNANVGSFLRVPEDLEGLRSQKKIIFQNSQIKV